MPSAGTFCICRVQGVLPGRSLIHHWQLDVVSTYSIYFSYFFTMTPQASIHLFVSCVSIRRRLRRYWRWLVFGSGCIAVVWLSAPKGGKVEKEEKVLLCLCCALKSRVCLLLYCTVLPISSVVTVDLLRVAQRSAASCVLFFTISE